MTLFREADTADLFAGPDVTGGFEDVDLTDAGVVRGSDRGTKVLAGVEVLPVVLGGCGESGFVVHDRIMAHIGGLHRLHMPTGVAYTGGMMENLPSRRDTSTPEKRLAWAMFDQDEAEKQITVSLSRADLKRIQDLLDLEIRYTIAYRTLPWSHGIEAELATLTGLESTRDHLKSQLD